MTRPKIMNTTCKMPIKLMNSEKKVPKMVEENLQSGPMGEINFFTDKFSSVRLLIENRMKHVDLKKLPKKHHLWCIKIEKNKIKLWRT